MRTDYDEIREELKDKLKECEKIAKKLLDDSIWGYSDMQKGYDIDVYAAVRKAKDMI